MTSATSKVPSDKIKSKKVDNESKEAKTIKSDLSDDSKETAEEFNKHEEMYRKLSQVIIKLEEKGLPIKEAAYGKSRTEYLRGDDLLKSLKENLEFVCKEIKTITGEEINPSDSDALQRVYEEFNLRNMMMKALKFKDDGKIKYPKRLAPYEEKIMCCDKKHDGEDDHAHNVPREEMIKFEEKMFYVLDIYRSKRSVYLYLSIVVVGILMYCLFPVWPVEVKIAVWWICYILLNLMIGIIVIRLIIFAFMYVFGLDFWVFPNLFDEKLGVLESFVPFVSWNKRTETLLTILIRVSITAFVGYLCWTVYDNPNTVNEFGQHVADLYVDFFEWGKEKVINYGNSTALNIKNNKYANLIDDEEEL